MMLTLTRVVQTFPSARIPSMSGGVPVEVSLIAQLGHGAGNHLFASVASRQRRHTAFVDELDEPSAKLGGTHFSQGDPTSLYSFVVGPKGHPFHRHAGHRIFTGVSGSGGAQLRFSALRHGTSRKTRVISRARCVSSIFRRIACSPCASGAKPGISSCRCRAIPCIPFSSRCPAIPMNLAAIYPMN